LYPSIAAAGFALTRDISPIWWSSLILPITLLAWTIFVGVIALFFLGLHPQHGASVVTAGLTLILAVFGFVLLLNPTFGITQGIHPTATPTGVVMTATPLAESIMTSSTVTPSFTATLTDTPLPSQTVSPTYTLVPTATQTLTPGPQPTPVWARVSAQAGNGVLVRAEPNYAGFVVQSLLNDKLVELLGEEVVAQNAIWVKVRTVDGKEGWVVRSLLITATPTS